ncbi:hypothetical protein A3C17_02525 [Candidatus Uhrbacteria bacterium RIFCSPHIGHO2_02_FULL_53_13]|uniref:Nucleoside triphosphate pyrophosphatase n=2 Tax=Candidatus Uhriibacteriota TaxID=1752732 RepID=A0A1F7TVT0_9BACT|nr:MAG: hypothetical protein A3C17_02525 [Candidatus Uhrbacteria bacterium RIFCSPHIGHO2_02_FULL_53_13]OGL89552.1 MAG: hypothetical protein A3I45_04725 [Candidatus Uhrbacteria bacterium RIFCSPLOWO2_02_FULL_53_10]
MNIILGSSSKFRQHAFTQVTPDFTCLAPDVDEKAIRDDDPKRLTLKIAHAKADALMPNIIEPSILVTADQVVVFKGIIREKPDSEAQCRTFLKSYSNNAVEVVNGVVVTNTETGKRAEGIDTVRVMFETIPDHAIDELIKEGDALHCAGGLKGVCSLLRPYVASMKGTPESLQGVPVALIKRLMEEVR